MTKSGSFHEVLPVIPTAITDAVGGKYYILCNRTNDEDARESFLRNVLLIIIALREVEKEASASYIKNSSERRFFLHFHLFHHD